MSLIIATGANLGDKWRNLLEAKKRLQDHFDLIAQSSVYSSPPVGNTEQPDFYNQVLEFKIPSIEPVEAMELLLQIEKNMGRTRDIKWGPRVIDLDIIFWGDLKLNSKNLQLPHPRWSERAFVALPLRELPFFKTIEKSYKIPLEFDHQAVRATEPGIKESPGSED